MVGTMTTLRPQLVRADTLDLQSHDSPSAQDHSRQPQHPAPYGYGPAAPHQAQTLRHAEEDALHQQASPHVLDDGIHHGLFSADQAFYDDPDDDLDDEHANLFHAVNGVHPQDHDYDDGEASDSHDEDMDDDLMDKISSSPSIEDEDIDFEFVYALHTFVATVEGQANATKGDTMVLLDDSNSYWWLVRVVKDGSIGYLPAEHIETPTERLARLNKHRNIDLSASMLGDNPEKSKNPLKKAMRRRNAKTVQFTAPTYYEPSEYDYSDNDEADEGGPLEAGEQGQGAPGHADEAEAAAAQQQVEDVAVARPVHDSQEARDENVAVADGLHTTMATTSNEPMLEDQQDQSTSSDPSQLSPTTSGSQEPVSRSRKGVVRNTDSFFKDDTAETKKISLTPRLLQADSEVAGSTEQAEARGRHSDETFDKILYADEKLKDQPRKEKKGMFSGLFKRKDKNSKTNTGMYPDRSEKTSEDSQRGHSPVSKDSLDSFTGPERRPSKLQKAPPSQAGMALSPTEARAPELDQAAVVAAGAAGVVGTGAAVAAGAAGSTPTSPISAMHPVHAPAPLNITHEVEERSNEPGPAQTREADAEIAPSTALSAAAAAAAAHGDSTTTAPITDPIQSSLANETGPSQAADFSTHSKLASAALAAAGAAGAAGVAGVAGAAGVAGVAGAAGVGAGAAGDGHESSAAEGSQAQSKWNVSPVSESQGGHRRNDSGMEISPIESAATENGPGAFAAAGVVDGQQHAQSHFGDEAGDHTEERSAYQTQQQAAGSTPVEYEPTASTSKPSPSTATSHTMSTSRSTPTWSDASLRTYMENDQDIKDLLIIVHDKANVQPVSSDHPLMANLFSNERSKLVEMQSQLDNLLLGWVSRKNSTLLSR